MKTAVQISLDLTSIEDALQTARLALRAGVDWLEAGTPLLAAEGAGAVRALRREFPDVPIIADLKIMDGGYLETRLMAEAGATYVVVMERAHPETVREVVRAGKDFGIKVMGDNMVATSRVDAAKRLEDLGCDFIVHHVGFDERRGIARAGERMPSPLDELRAIVDAVSVPVQAVGGLTVEQAVRTPEYGAPLVVLGAPLLLAPGADQAAKDELENNLRTICTQVHAYGEVPVKNEQRRA